MHLLTEAKPIYGTPVDLIPGNNDIGELHTGDGRARHASPRPCSLGASAFSTLHHSLRILGPAPLSSTFQKPKPKDLLHGDWLRGVRTVLLNQLAFSMRVVPAKEKAIP